MAGAGVVRARRREGKYNDEKHKREGKRRAGPSVASRSRWWNAAFVTLLGASMVRTSAALDMDYCSTLNTGSDGDKMTNTWQSDGLCHDNCDGYAFAVIQGSNCWCSNYAPGVTTDTGNCNESCPGYPSDTCGSTDDDLFGYMALGKSPSGTQGGSSSTASSTKTSTSSKTSSSTHTTSTPTTTSKSSTHATTTSAPQTTLITSAINGSAKTMYITVSATPTSTTVPTASASSSASSKPFMQTPGKVAGLFTGLAFATIGLVSLLLFLFRRKQQRNSMYREGSPIPSLMPSLSGGRRRSTLSSLGLLGGSSEKGTMGSPTSGALPAFPAKAAMSEPKLVDQRLDAGQLFMYTDGEVNSSRNSVRSLRDDADYSRRVLRLANPDD